MDLSPEDATSVLHQTIPATAGLGIEVTDVGAGAVTLRVPLEGNSNHFGAMYAGALFAVAELPGGLIPVGVLGPFDHTSILTDMTLRFVAPARSDVTVTARMDPEELVGLASRADAEGRAVFTLALEGRDDSGRTVIVSEGTYQLRPRRSQDRLSPDPSRSTAPPPARSSRSAPA